MWHTITEWSLLLLNFKTSECVLPGMTLSPGAMSGDIFGYRNYCHLVGGGQRCCLTSCNAQQDPPQRMILSKMSVVTVQRLEAWKWPCLPTCLLGKESIAASERGNNADACGGHGRQWVMSVDVQRSFIYFLINCWTSAPPSIKKKCLLLSLFG